MSVAATLPKLPAPTYLPAFAVFFVARHMADTAHATAKLHERPRAGANEAMRRESNRKYFAALECLKHYRALCVALVNADSVDAIRAFLAMATDDVCNVVARVSLLELTGSFVGDQPAAQKLACSRDVLPMLEGFVRIAEHVAEHGATPDVIDAFTSEAGRSA